MQSGRDSIMMMLVVLAVLLLAVGGLYMAFFQPATEIDTELPAATTEPMAERPPVAEVDGEAESAVPVPKVAPEEQPVVVKPAPVVPEAHATGKFTYIIEGAVTNAKSRLPVPNATVELQWIYTRDGEAMIGKPGSEFGAAAKATTDAKGRYRIELRGDASYETVSLTCAAENLYASWNVTSNFSPSGDIQRTATADFSLQPGLTIAGIVTDPSGAPCAGATVQSMKLNEEANDGMHPGAVHLGGDSTGSTATGEDGAFQLVVTTGKYRLVATSPEHALVIGEVLEVEDAGIDGVRLQLNAGATLSGRVTDTDGNPLDAMITVHRDWSGMPSETDQMVWGIDQPRTQAAADGGYVLRGLGESRYSIRFGKEGYVAEVREWQPRGPETKVLDVVLKRGTTVSGIVVDGEGQPLQGVGVSIHGRGATNWETSQGYMSTDAQGAFSMSGLADGEHQLSASKQGYQNYQQDGMKLPAPDAMRIVLRKAPSIRVQARDADTGKWLDNYRVVLQAGGMFGGGGSHSETVTTAEPFSLPLSSTEYKTVMASADGYPVTKPVRIEQKHLNGEVMVLEFETGGCVTGRLLSAVGEPLTGSHVAVVPASVAKSPMMAMEGRGRGSQAAQSDSEGRFTVKGVTPGKDLAVLAMTQNRPTIAHFGVEVRKGDTVDVGDLRAPAGGDIHGIIQDAEGRPLEGVGVQIVNMAAMDFRGTVTDELGEFRVVDFSPGNTIIAIESGQKREQRSVAVKAGETVTVRIGGSTTHGDMVVDFTVDGEPGKQIAMIRMTDSRSGFQELTGEDGRFTASHVEDGSYLLLPTLGGLHHLPAMEVPVTVRGGQSVYREVHVRTGSLRVQVKDQAGVPLPGAKVAVYSDSLQVLRGFMQMGVFLDDGDAASSNGEWQSGGIVTGGCAVMVYKEGYETVMLPGLSIQAGQETVCVAAMRPVTSPATVKIRLVDAAGAPVPGMFLSLLCDANANTLYASAQPGMAGTMSADGEYEIAQVPAGRYLLRMINMGAGANASCMLDVAAGQTVERTLTMQSPGGIDLTVLDAAGQPAMDRSLRILDPNGADISFMISFTSMEFFGNVSGDDGHWKRGNLEPGVYTIVKMNEANASSCQVTVQPGQTATATLTVK